MRYGVLLWTLLVSLLGAAWCATADPASDAAARDILTQAAKLRQHKQYTEALAAYTDLIATPGISPELTAKARLDKNATAIEQALAAKTSWVKEVVQAFLDLSVSAVKGLVTLLVWIVILLAAFGAAAGVHWLLPPKPGLLIDLLDLSASDRDGGSRMLSAELARLLAPDAPAAASDVMFESMTDFEGGSSASIKPMVQLPGIDSMLNTTANVSIGPLQFTPAAVLGLLRRLVQPDHENVLSGALFVQGSRTTMSLQVACKSGKTVPNAVWQVADDGPDSRRTVLRRAAVRLLLLFADGRSVTSDAKSLECVLKGFDVLGMAAGGPPNQQIQREAALCFQNALAFDPANWLARFNLSVMARQLGDNEFAIQNCLLLEQLFDHPPEPLRRHMAKYPDFALCVVYNRALALSKFSSWSANNCALGLFDRILAAPRCPLTLPAQSARAACLLFRYESFRAAGENARANAKDVREQIRDVKMSLEAQAQQGDMSRTLVMSRAVVLNAFGCLQEKEGIWSGARTDLELAVALQPDLVEAHINLGRLYRHGRAKVAGDWVSRARAHLAEALLIQPENREANYEMGRLLADDAVRDYPAALESFAKAAPHSLAAFQAGKIYCDPDFPGTDLDKGIEQLRASVGLAGACDFRLLELASRLLEAGEKLCALAHIAKTIEAVQNCCNRARHLSGSAQRALKQALEAENEHDRQRAESMMERAGRLVETIHGLSTPAATA